MEKEAPQKDAAKVVPINLEKKSVDPSPAAKRVIAENNLDVSSIRGDGKKRSNFKKRFDWINGSEPWFR